ncbi:PAS domain-containing protein [Methylobacterium sp. 37f]|uniref:PAS domain-containing protein n=1 Tax=Methylobacterium sp. 37f TaxID=2817058 RepID=UPI001FFDB306|nr:PAS domain-containing protein [Methylobacterium sp. 37f]MCK2052516.1 PAS domain-containing protein [Methylobacterium sp. 37f]
MDVDDLGFSSRYFLTLIESQGVTGTWGWRFADHQHVWSPGLFCILGLDAQSTRPSYDRLVGLIHPQDRHRVQTGADLRHGVTLGQQTLRILRPDKTVRMLSARTEIYLGVDGRPRGAAGVVLDVTDQAILQQARLTEKRHRRALFLEKRILTFSSHETNRFSSQEESSEMTGIPMGEIATDAFVAIVNEDRERMRVENGVLLEAGKAYRSVALLRLAGNNRGRFESFIVPVRTEGGDVREWAGVTRPMGSTTSPVADQFLEGLEQAIDGRHLRAARALLDWSMTQFAQAAGLSLSTVKRMEENIDGIALQSRHKAVATLRRFGIRFSLMEGGVIGVSAT